MARVMHLTARLWAEYTRQVRAGSRLRRRTEVRWQSEIDQLVEAHLGLAEKIARQVWHKFTRAGQDGYHSHIELDDMIAYGRLGLVEAARRYDPTHGEFAPYAFRRIRGAIIDAHRRAAYRESLNDSVEAIEERQGFLPAAMITDRGPLPDELAAAKEMARIAARAIALLPDDERDVLRATLAGVPLDEVAAARGRSLAWGRAKLAAGREKAAATVAQLRRAA